MEDMDVASFAFSGKVKIRITAKDKIESYIIRPKSRRILAEVSGNEISFSVDSPQKLYIEINNLPHLALFAISLNLNLRNLKTKALHILVRVNTDLAKSILKATRRYTLLKVL